MHLLEGMSEDVFDVVDFEVDFEELFGGELGVSEVGLHVVCVLILKYYGQSGGKLLNGTGRRKKGRNLIRNLRNNWEMD